MKLYFRGLEKVRLINPVFCGFLFLLFHFFSVLSQAQSFQYEALNITDQFNYNYSDGSSGGWMAPQFSSFDIDRNGQKEIIAFDRYSQLFSVWQYSPSKNEYFLVRDNSILWPRLQHWALIRDYNSDGIPDIFTQGNFGISIWEGKLVNGVITFSQLRGSDFIDDSLKFQSPDGSFTNIYHSNSDIPVIQDVDGDGDLDIMSFESTGSFVYFYQCNTNVNGQPLLYRLKHNCWGNFVESGLSNGVKLSNSRFFCPLPFTLRHVGSSLCMTDINHDSLPDLLVGDRSFPNLMALTNAYTADSGFIDQQRNAFPYYSNPAYIYNFPAAYAIDYDQDGWDDVIVANNDEGQYDFNSLYLYHNEQKKDESFTFVTSNAWSQSSFDLGRNTAPYYIDVNGDDIQDVIIGYNIAVGQAIPENRLALWYGRESNTGKLTYQMVDDDYLSLGSKVSTGIRPILTSGDIDGDGDLDLVIGMSNGDIHLLTNNSSQSKIFEEGEFIKDWMSLDIGLGAAPELFDIDGDGLLDLLVGQDRGMVHFFKNIGSQVQANFNPDPSLEPNIEEFLDISTVGSFYILGRSIPRILDVNGKLILAVTGYEGDIQTFESTSENGLEWTENSDMSNLFTGVNGNLTAGRIHNNQIPLLLGNIGGGLLFAQSDIVSSSKIPIQYKDLVLSPNPIVKGQEIHLGLDIVRPQMSAIVLDIQGRQIHIQPLMEKSSILNVKFNYSGVYVVLIKVENEVVYSGKLIVQ
ncbi:FG-GAP repeat domain-containing protein [Membranihabitans marinus]|uniref:FG-GAP repeat domain-containing protein n=1 Tax=Membranihabitans marinus TaxID=1227546 RepID=UPI001F25B8FB|nr:T9SS type A sorting domain-containing protein [Membranihabitans marinus]